MQCLVFLWERRNTFLHGASDYANRVIWDVSNTTHTFIKSKFNYLNTPNNWPQMVIVMDSSGLVLHLQW